jgi:hypothetical protein
VSYRFHILERRPILIHFVWKGTLYDTPKIPATQSVFLPVDYSFAGDPGACRSACPICGCGPARIAHAATHETPCRFPDPNRITHTNTG